MNGLIKLCLFIGVMIGCAYLGEAIAGAAGLGTGPVAAIIGAMTPLTLFCCVKCCLCCFKDINNNDGLGIDIHPRHNLPVGVGDRSEQPQLEHEGMPNIHGNLRVGDDEGVEQKAEQKERNSQIEGNVVMDINNNDDDPGGVAHPNIYTALPGAGIEGHRPLDEGDEINPGAPSP